MSPQQNTTTGPMTKVIIARLAPSLKNAIAKAPPNAVIECGFYDGSKWVYARLGTATEISQFLRENGVK
jgi:hypothetical protein